jgi:hypothetical protein
MLKVYLTIAMLIGSCLLLPSSVVADPILGQIDTFETGSQGWFTGGVVVLPPQPAVIQTGGPTGNFMVLTAIGGLGSNSRLTVLNDAQWTGNYLSAGVSLITMDVINLGQTDLYLRLMFEDPMFGPPTNIAFSTNPIFLPVGSGWTSVSFVIDPASLTAGLGSINEALTGTTAIRLYHSQAPGFPNPVFPIDTVVGQVGVDNITASAIPEPTTAVLLISGFAAVAVKLRRGRKVK